jgi:hypothetical protein
MLNVMREHYNAGRLDRAAEIAKDAAPYCHSRLSTVAHEGSLGVQLQVTEEIVDADPHQNGQAAPCQDSHPKRA